ncbi:MAG: metallophosphoesterase [Candidatus Thorarchaeota archaeon]
MQLKFLILTDIHDTWVHLDKMLRLASEMDGVIFLGDLMTFRKFTQASIDNLTRIKEASNWMIGVPGNGPLPRVREALDNLGINIHCKGQSFEDVGFFGVGGVQETSKTISDIREFFKTQDTSSISPDERTMETWNAFGIFFENGKFVVEEWSDFVLSKLDVYTSPFEHPEEQIHEILVTAYEQIKSSPIKILISHMPPYEPGVVSAFAIGVSTGSKAVAQFIAEHDVSLSLSGHNHQHYTFQIENTDCIMIPAVVNGFYGVLSVEAETMELNVEIRKF